MDQVSAPAEMIGISKSYGGVEAVRNVDVTVGPGEVHALLGENGAGSTLMKILFGEVGGHRGEIRIGGAQVKFARPLDAQRAGVAMISQELALVPALSLPENIRPGADDRFRQAGSPPDAPRDTEPAGADRRRPGCGSFRRTASYR
jgi:ribose transport system ATP-binding protein